MAHPHIQRLNARLAQRDSEIEKLTVIVKALRREQPELSQLVTERELLAKAVEIYEEEVTRLTKTVGGAFEMAARRELAKSRSITVDVFDDDEAVALKAAPSPLTKAIEQALGTGSATIGDPKADPKALR